MMTWTLDTCGFDTKENCQVELDNPWIFVRFLRKCPAHKDIPDTVEAFNQLHDENKRGPSNTIDEVKKNIGEKDIRWKWTGKFPNRVLSVDLPEDLTTSQRDNVKGALNKRLGSGKVIVG